MPTDWRSLFNEVGVHWVDRGPNSMYGQPVIACPLCGNDPSQHLNFSDIGYYCLRNHGHGGSNFVFILRRLLPATSRTAILELLNRHATTEVSVRERPKPQPASVIEQKWSQFQPADTHPAYLDYLHRRGFPDPAVLCRRHDLRYALKGQWAARLLIPITDIDGSLLAWTGRAIRDIQPRYLNLATHHDGLVYVPGAMRATALLVEGPMDALRVIQASRNIAPIALLGLGTNPARLLRLAGRLGGLLRNCREVLVCFDPGVPPAVYKGLFVGLAQLRLSAIVRRLRLPPGWEDFGATPVDSLAVHLNDLNWTRENVDVTVEEYNAAMR